MIEVLSILDTCICQNCGGPIDLMSGDLSGARWYHAVGESGSGKRECPGTLYAEPLPECAVPDGTNTPAGEPP